MSEATQEREVELVQGTIKGIIVKGVGKWQVEVQPDGSQYTKKLWTKDKELVDSIPAKIGQFGAFVCSASMWTNNEGKPVRSLWISGEKDGNENVPERVATPETALAQGYVAGQPVGPPIRVPVTKGSGEMSKEEWARKDSAIHKMACIKTAAAALTHTMPADPSPDDLSKFIGRVKFLSHEWHTQVEAVRAGDDSDLPFLSQADIDEIPY